MVADLLSAGNEGVLEVQVVSNIIPFETNGGMALGYRAELLALTCEVFLQTREAATVKA
jgi:hypothetical protein